MTRLLLAAALLAGPAAYAQTAARPMTAPVRPTPTVAQDPALVQRYQATITPDELAGHLYVYASDHFAGRDTGSPGESLARLYLAGQYRQMGIGPRGTAADTTGNYGLGAYMQPFTLERSTLQSLSVTASRGGTALAESRLAAGDTDATLFVPVGGEVPDAPVTAPLVYVGYGADVVASTPDVRGKVVLLRPGSPGNPGDRSAMGAAFEALGESGAVAVLLPMMPTAAALSRFAARAVSGGGGLSLPPAPGEAAGADEPLALLTGLDVAERLVGSFDAATAGDTGVTITIDGRQTRETVHTANVLAVIPGSDLADEVVIVSAHLDHVGTREGEGDTIFNGADDDGSGTVTMLEIAEAFETARRDGHGPRRTVLILHVTGEERGLLGSEYYADREPVFPLAQTVTNLNVDMIGRHDPTHPGADSNYVYVIGGDLISQDLHDWNAAVNTTTGLDLDLSDRFNSPDDPNQFFRRSDHWNFGKHDVPFIFYFTGTHEDYHQVGDEPHKIDYDRMATIGRLIFGTAWDVANRDARPAVSGEGFN